MAKRQSVDDLTYVFCSEHETCAHQLFEYFVAQAIWGELKTLLGRNNIEISFSSIASMWLCEKKISFITQYMMLCYVSSGLLEMTCILTALLRLVYRRWPLCSPSGSQDTREGVEQVIQNMVHLGQAPPPLLWSDPR